MIDSNSEESAGEIYAISSEQEQSSLCRICIKDASIDRLIKPCRCTGRIQYAHKGCLEQWLEDLNVDFCELCHYHYKIIKTRKSFCEWLKSSDGERERRVLTVEIMFYAVMLFWLLSSIWLEVMGALFYLNVKHSIVGVVAVIPIAVYSTGILIYNPVRTLRQHWVNFTKWRDQHWHVRVLEFYGDSPPIASSPSLAAVSLDTHLIVQYRNTKTGV